MTNISAKDESSNHRYYTETPNIIFEIGLKANQISLYLAIKRCAGEQGYCTKSSATLCKEAGVGVRNFSKLKQSLAEVNKILKCPLIIVKPRFTEVGDSDTDLITVVDIWNINMQYFLDKRGGAKLQVPGAKLQGGVPAKMQGGGAKLQDKQQPLKNNLFEEQQQVAVFLDSLVKEGKLTRENVSSLMNFPPNRIKLALEFSKKVKPKKTLIHQLMWHCASHSPPKIPAPDFWDAFRSHFKNNGRYEGATCYINSETVAFERGITHKQVYLNKPGAKEEILTILQGFGINWSYENV